MLRKKIVRGLAGLLTALLLIAAMPARSLAASVYNIRVTSSYTYIYKTASTSSARLKKVSKGAVLACGAAKGSWAYVKYNGVIGYVRTADVTAAGSSTGTADKTDQPPKTVEPDGAVDEAELGNAAIQTYPSGLAVRATAAVRLYKSASTSSGYYGTIPKGKQLTCYKANGTWAYVQVGKYKGYVLKIGLAEVKNGANDPASGTVDPASVKGVSCYAKKTCDLFASASPNAAAVCSLSIGEKIIVTHVKAGWCRVVTARGQVGYLPDTVVSKTKIYVNGNIVLADWYTSDIQNAFHVGSTAMVTDVLTRSTFAIRRRGGINHADCEPLTRADTATVLSFYGSTSWDRRAIWVTVDNVTYAASMNFMNHGDQTIQNNGFNGHFCVHFYNSRTSGTNKVDADHQAAVLAAFNATP